ncbi:hypothetical protein [Paenibacillus sp. KS-LC4]|uniref:hypothetical protein n=1 Tax=Paenibacillus sp. KS-LC4 TaxID=2979727 RepID=UPI0030D079AF
MIKHFTGLISKMATLPLTEFLFVKEPLFRNLIHVSTNSGEGKEKYKKYEQYEQLKKKVQQELVGSHYIKSFDTINLLLEQYFPMKVFAEVYSEDEIYIGQLNKLTKSFITHRNGKIALKYWKSENDEKLFSAFEGLNKIEVWNVLSRMFCIDILVVMYLLNNKMTKPEYLNGYYWLINLGDMQLDRIMERGLAETHIHISAGINFNMMWQDLMNINLESSKIKLTKLDKMVADPHLEHSIRMSGLIRIMISKYLANAEHDCFIEQFDKYNRCIEWYLTRNGAPIEQNYKKLHKELLSDITDDSGKNMDTSTEIVKLLFGLEDLHTTDENVFLFQVMKYIMEQSDRDKDPHLTQLFWQYLRIKNIVYQGVTQGNFVEGLDYFRHFFSAATSISQNQLEHAIRNQIYNNNLKKLEIRVSPPTRGTAHEMSQSLKRNLIIFFETYKSIVQDNKLPYDQIPQMGVVFHFLKAQDETFYEKCWYADVNRAFLRHENYFYGSLQKKYRETVDVINDLRERIPGLSRYIVGLDAASLENNTEPWVFAPIFRHVRNSPVSKIRLLESGEPIQTLGFTYHVGEEFRHLLSGLRHVDEVIEHFNYRVSDRIGHGLALGVDAEGWCKENPVVVLPRIEYMENLLWLWGQAFLEKKHNLEIDLLGIEREIMLQVEKIYYNVEGITLFVLWKAYQGKFKPFKTDEAMIHQVCVSETGRTGKWRNEWTLPEQHFCKQGTGEASYWNESKLIHANHCKCFLERMYEVIQIKIGENEARLLDSLQSYVRNKLNDKGIVVETNPTSNLAISGIEKLFSHPVTSFNTNGLENDRYSGKGLVISINSDDPAVFNTSISNELSYIFYLLQDKGYSRDAILEWIEKIRDWGVMTSFIQDRTISKENLIKELDSIIMKLK